MTRTMKWAIARKYFPRLCQKCKKGHAKILVNISGNYKLDVKDYKYICSSCMNIYYGKPMQLVGRTK